MENRTRYPRLIVDLEKLKENIAIAIKECSEYGVRIAGVIKGCHGRTEILPAYLESDLPEIASSRLEQLRRVREMGWKRDLMLVRIPMASEIEEVVELTDISLNSEIETLRLLNEEALRQGKKHKVIVMADVGDLREGFWDKDEMVQVCREVEEQMDGLILEGIGTNIGCYGSLVPTAEKMGEIIPIRDAVEEAIGRKLNTISAGSSTGYMRIKDGDLPEGINHYRLGENILLARDNEDFFGYSMAPLKKGVFTLEAQVIEVKVKPSKPQGEVNIDAFGRKREYPDRGIRARAILGIGRVDVGEFTDVFPRMEGVEIMGGSSDHMIVDVQDVFDRGEEIKVGDVLVFDIDYGAMVFLTGSENVRLDLI